MKEGENNLTLEEVRLNEILKSAAEKVSIINTTLEKIENDKGNTPRPSPFGPTPPGSQKEALKNKLKQEKKDIEDQTKQTINSEIKQSGKEPTASMVLKIEEWNEDTSKYPRDAYEIRQAKEQRDITESQRFALKIKASKESGKSYDALVKDDTEGNNKEGSLSRKFEKSLRFTQFKENKSSLEKAINKEAQPSQRTISENAKHRSHDFDDNKRDIEKEL